MPVSTLASPPKSAVAVGGGLSPYAGTFGKEQLIHLLRRTMFGLKKADIDAFAGQSLNQVVDTLLTPEPIPTAFPLRNYQTTDAAADPNVPVGQTWVFAPTEGGVNGGRTASLQAWWTGLLLNQRRSVHQRLNLFWHDHFAIEFPEVEATMSFDYTMLLMRNANGNFKTFVRDITLNAAMLRYLNGDRNTKAAPDENYARELQELFAVGKGPGSGYTEDDVKAAAKILTGWRTRRLPTAADPTRHEWRLIFSPNDHDTTEKKFSAFYGNRSIKSGTVNNEANARKELDELLDMIFAQRETALFMARNLYRFFVYYEIDAAVERDVIAPMADLFIANNWEIKPVLKAMFTSEHFFMADVRSCFIKSPLEYCVGAMREFNVEFPNDSNVLVQYTAWNSIFSVRNNGAASQGQLIGSPPNVAGWGAYYQEPGYHRNWINTDSFAKRLRFMEPLFTNNGIGIGGGQRLIINVAAFNDQFGADAANPNKVIDRAIELLYRAPVTQKFKDYAKNTFLLDNLSDDSYWTEAWLAYKANPTNAMALNVVTTRLRALYRFLVGNTEYQLS